MNDPNGDPADTVPPRSVSFHEAVRVWWRIGWLSFGGPAAQIALMHRELIERQRWISEPRFLHALNYCMLLPGPEAQQLAVYIGWLMHRTWGGIVAGALFVLPGFAVMLALSVLYVRYQDVSWVAALLFGLKAAVLAIVMEAVLRIGRRALRNRLMIGLAGAAFVAIHFLHVPFPWIVAAAGAVGFLAHRLAPALMPDSNANDVSVDQQYVVDRLLASGELAHARPSVRRAIRILVVCVALWFAPVALIAAWLGWSHVLTRESLFFSQTAVVTFGGAYAVLAYVAQRAVESFDWLAPGEMIDGLALAETRPGPLIMVVQFVGFLAAYRHAGPLDPWLAAVLGAVLTTWVTFLPCFLFIFVGAPYVEALRRRGDLRAALSAVTAAVVGVVLNLSVWFAVHTIFGRVDARRLGPLHLDVPVWSTLEPGALVLGAASLIAMLRYKVGMGHTLLGAGVLGAIYWYVRASLTA